MTELPPGEVSDWERAKNTGISEIENVLDIKHE